MGISFQRGVYVSYFGTRCLRKDLGNAYNADSSLFNAHLNVYNKFKVAEANNIQGPLVYSESQVVQLPEQGKGLVKQSFAGYVPLPFTTVHTPSLRW